MKSKIQIGFARAQLLNEQIANDVAFLQKLGIMDYRCSLFSLDRPFAPLPLPTSPNLRIHCWRVPLIWVWGCL